MKIAIYSPYLDTAGGGEKYILTLAETLSKEHEVDVLLDTHLQSLDIESIKQRIFKLHELDFSKVNFIPAPLGQGSSFFSRYFFLKEYDWLFYLTDGSLFLSTAKNNVIHFQVPFENTNKSWWNLQKLKSWQSAIYNSKFTKDIVEQTWDIQGEVVYPPVSIEEFSPGIKKKQILSVGRFFGYLKDKKQAILIEAFKRLVDGGVKDWSLNLAGGAGEGDKDYVEELKTLAKGYDVKFYPNIPFQDLKKLYSESSIYWHASGFGETDPKKMEHFGITTVEGMAAGCVPVVIGLGGQIEIVENGKSGYLWNDLDELNNHTLELIKDSKLTEKMSKEAIKRSLLFSKERFVNKVKELVDGK